MVVPIMAFTTNGSQNDSLYRILTAYTEFTGFDRKPVKHLTLLPGCKLVS
jgi:hypothetical protein